MRQYLLLLFRRAAEQNGERDQVWSRQRQCRAEIAPRQLFRGQDPCERRMLAETAIFLGNAGRQQSQFPAGLHPFRRGFALFVGIAHPAAKFFRCQLFCRIHNHFLFIRRFK